MKTTSKAAGLAASVLLGFNFISAAVPSGIIPRQESVQCWLPVASERSADFTLIPGENIQTVETAELCRAMSGVIWGNLGIGAENERFSEFSMETPETGEFLYQDKKDVPEGERGKVVTKEKRPDATIQLIIFLLEIWKKRYVKGTYDCKHFSRDLYDKLEESGIDATMTAILCDTDGDGLAGTVKDGEGHMVVDIHGSDGSTIWVEPQAMPPFYEVKMDLSNPPDGKVTYRLGGSVGGPLYTKIFNQKSTSADVDLTPTEGKCLYLVFD